MPLPTATLELCTCSEMNTRLAEEALRRALHLEPDVAIAHYNLGVLYMRIGRRELAQTAFETAEQLRRAEASP